MLNVMAVWNYVKRQITRLPVVYILYDRIAITLKKDSVTPYHNKQTSAHTLIDYYEICIETLAKMLYIL